MSECIHCGATDDEANGIIVGAVGDLNESVCNVCRSDQIQAETALKKREAEVYALKEQGYSHAKIADLLGIAKSTTDEYSSRINDRIQRARKTIALDEGRL